MPKVREHGQFLHCQSPRLKRSKFRILHRRISHFVIPRITYCSQSKYPVLKYSQPCLNFICFSNENIRKTLKSKRILKQNCPGCQNGTKFRILYHQEPFNAGLGIQTEILIIYCYNCTLLLSLVEFGMFKHQGYPVKRWWHLVLTSSLSSASKSLHISHIVSYLYQCKDL